MIIRDNLLTLKEIEELKSAIDFEIKIYNRKFTECEFDSEEDHHGLKNSTLYYLENEARDLYLKFLIKNKFFDEKCLTELDLTLRYHGIKSPYSSTWHKDRLADWDGDIIDYIGVSYFLNNKWDHTNGGMFVYKEHKESTQGYYIEPTGNRIVINDDDLYHAVTTVTNQSVERKSLQMFIHKKYLLT
jgi:hypothetical protein